MKVKLFTIVSLTSIDYLCLAQNENEISPLVSLESFAIYLVVTLVVFLILRFVALWYFKIEERMDLQRRQISLLESIDKSIKSVLPKEQKKEIPISENEDSLNSPEVLEELLKNLESKK